MSLQATLPVASLEGEAKSHTVAPLHGTCQACWCLMSLQATLPVAVLEDEAHSQGSYAIVPLHSTCQACWRLISLQATLPVAVSEGEASRQLCSRTRCTVQARLVGASCLCGLRRL